MSYALCGNTDEATTSLPFLYISLVVAYEVSTLSVHFSIFYKFISDICFVTCADFSITMDIDVNVQQRIVIKFLVRAGKTNAEIKNMMLSVYRNATLKRPTLYEWIGRFRERRESVLDDEGLADCFL